LRRHKATLHPQTPWIGGTPYLPAQMQYTSAALSFLLRDRLNPIPDHYGKEQSGSSHREYLPAHLELSYSQKYPQVVLEYFRVNYNRVIGWLLNGAEWIGKSVQNGDVRRYLSYIFWVNAVALLLFLFYRGT